MSVFKISKGVCKEITDAIAGFRLGDDENQRECIGGLSGNYVFPKKDGGMALGASTPSTYQCLQSNGGAYLMIQSPYVPQFFMQHTTPLETYYPWD